MILVIGAGGVTGAAVSRALAARGSFVRALVRDLRRTPMLERDARIQRIQGDLSEPSMIAAAMRGVDGVFVPWFCAASDPGLAEIVIAAARGAGTERIVTMSLLGASPDAGSELLRHCAALERMFSSAGFESAHLRCGLLMQTLLELAPTIGARATICVPTTSAPVRFIDVRDVADVAAGTLTSTGCAECVLELVGPDRHSFVTMAAMLSAVLGEPVRCAKGRLDSTALDRVFAAVCEGAAEYDACEPTPTTDEQSRSLADFFAEHRGAFLGPAGSGEPRT